MLIMYKKMGLILYIMNSGLVFNTPANKSVTTSLVCLNCPLSIYGRDFGIDLICLPLEDIDVIMGINWLELNHVYNNCYNKTLRFLAPEDKKEDYFISTKELKELFRDEAKAFAMFDSLSVESQTTIEGLPMVCEFLKVFPYDMSELSPKRELEFTIDLALGIMPVSMVPYIMSTSELGEFKNQLEDLLEKRFIRPSVSPSGASILLAKKKDGSMRLCVDYR